MHSLTEIMATAGSRPRSPSKTLVLVRHDPIPRTILIFAL